MKQGIFEITENKQIAPNVMQMRFIGDASDMKCPGQFVNIQLEGLYLRRPISLCDLNGDAITIIYKVVGEGTAQMAKMQKGEKLDVLTGLGNGYDLTCAGDAPLLIGGGAGVPPMYYLAKCLLREGKKPIAILGFNTKSEIFYEKEFQNLGIQTIVTTVDGSYGLKGFVTDAMKNLSYSHVFTCGPEPMLRAVYREVKTDAQFSFERRMGCGFGACMGCSCKTITGYKRICKEGPVMRKGDIIWED